MTDQDIRRAAALAQRLEAAHKELSLMARRWLAEARTCDDSLEGAAYAVCAAELAAYLIKWSKP